MRMMRTRPVLLCIVLLGGCAAGQSSYAARPEPDCSFRSAATCWTIAGRFPSRRPAAATRSLTRSGALPLGAGEQARFHPRIEVTARSL